MEKQSTLLSGETLTIREATKSDAASLLQYVNQIASESKFLTFGPGEFNKTVEEEGKIIEEHAEAENRIFLVAEFDGEIVGVLNVNASSKPRMKHIASFGLSVLKDHWGKGIGSILIKAMLEWAKGTGVIRKVNLNVMTNNEAAIALYEKFGFEKEGVIRREAFIDGEFYDAYVMGLLIDN